MNLNKKAKIFIAMFFFIWTIVIIIVVVHYINERELKKRIENSKATRTLVLDDISTAITLEELYDLEQSKEYLIERGSNIKNQEMVTVTFKDVFLYGSACKKRFVFYDNVLGSFTVYYDASQWTPGNIYEELVKINGEPDETNVKSQAYLRDVYFWYGKNGILVMINDKFTKTIEIWFDMR